jgi:hypothetical protein
MLGGSMSWWSKMWVVFVVLSSGLGCVRLAQGDVHNAVGVFATVPFFVAILVFERTDFSRVRRRGRSLAYWGVSILAVALSALVALVTGMVMLGVAALFALAITEARVENARA